MSTPLEPIPGETYADLAPIAKPPQQQQQQPSPPVESPNNPPWTIFGATGVWLASFLFILFTPLIFVLPFAWQRQIGLADFTEFAVTDKAAIFLQVLSVIPAHLLTLGLAWALVTQFGKRPFLRTLGWEWDERFGFWRSTGLAVALLLLGILIIKSLGGPETQIDRIINSSRATALSTAFMATATAPLVEEVVYRGILYSALHKAIGALGAVLIVLTLFALVHVPQYWPNFGIIGTIILLSASLTLIRAYTGKLLPCFIIHLIFNGIQSAAIVLEPYLKRFEPHTTAPPPAVVSFVARLFELLN